MARKIQVKLILLLRGTGMSQRAICQSRHMSRSSVSEVFRIADEQNITYADVESKSHAEVYSSTRTNIRKRTYTLQWITLMSTMNSSVRV